jgi:hypothetical protein
LFIAFTTSESFKAFASASKRLPQLGSRRQF